MNLRYIFSKKIIVALVLFMGLILSSAVNVLAAEEIISEATEDDAEIQTLSADCRYEDNLTPHRDYADWLITLVNTVLMVGKDYAPPDLVSVGNAGISGGGSVRKIMIDDLRSLAAAAKKNGTPIAVQSAYRSYSSQKSAFNLQVSRLGYQRALTYSARPGHSEHQLGMTIDFKTKDGIQPWKVSDWGKTPQGKWMMENAWKFGFVLSYPKDKTDVTCYRYEPWHYRYFGVDRAKQMHDSGLTTTEYLKGLN